MSLLYTSTEVSLVPLVRLYKKKTHRLSSALPIKECISILQVAMRIMHDIVHPEYR